MSSLSLHSSHLNRTLDTATSLEVISDLAQLQALAPEWQALWTRLQCECLFQTPTWHIAWWRAFGTQGTPHFLVFRNANQQLIAIAPLIRYVDRWHGIPVRIVGSYNNDHASRCDILCEPAHEVHVAQRMAGHLASTQWHWDALFLRQVPAEATWRSALQDACQAQGLMPFAPTPGTGKCVLPVQGTWSQYLASKTSHFRARLKENMRRVAKHGPITYRRSTGAAEDFAAFQQLEQASWKADDAYAKLGEVGWDFQQEVALSAAAGIRCYNLFLEMNGKILGGIHAVGTAGRMYSLQMLFDESVRSLYPGRAQFAVQIQDMFAADDVGLLDFNGNSPFCKSWTDVELQFVNQQIFSSNPYARALRFAKRHKKGHA